MKGSEKCGKILTKIKTDCVIFKRIRRNWQTFKYSSGLC